MILFNMSVSMDEAIKAISPNAVAWLLILLAVNIILLVVRFVLDWCRDKHENHNYKVKKISEKSIEIESEIYNRLQKLANYQREDCHEMLDEIIDDDKYIEENSLYISKKYRDEVTKILDYFKSLVTDFGKKDIRKEGQYFNKLSDIFYGE